MDELKEYVVVSSEAVTYVTKVQALNMHHARYLVESGEVDKGDLDDTFDFTIDSVTLSDIENKDLSEGWCLNCGAKLYRDKSIMNRFMFYSETCDDCRKLLNDYLVSEGRPIE